jgi:AcrR family transcriptional regulator
MRSAIAQLETLTRPPPAQVRSKRTLQRILNAVRKLLRDRPLSQISVGEITAKAKCSTGSFYQRFASKEDLLPALYEEYDRELRNRVQSMLSQIPMGADSLAGIAETLVGLIVDQYASERWLYREVALYARSRPEAITTDMIARRSELHRLPLEYLSRFRDQIRHPDPEAAILFAIFLVGAAAREKILFGDAPHAAVTNVSHDALKAQLTHAFIAYLTT